MTLNSGTVMRFLMNSVLLLKKPTENSNAQSEMKEHHNMVLLRH